MRTNKFCCALRPATEPVKVTVLVARTVVVEPSVTEIVIVPVPDVPSPLTYKKVLLAAKEPAVVLATFAVPSKEAEVVEPKATSPEPATVAETVVPVYELLEPSLMVIAMSPALAVLAALKESSVNAAFATASVTLLLMAVEYAAEKAGAAPHVIVRVTAAEELPLMVTT